MAIDWEKLKKKAKQADAKDGAKQAQSRSNNEPRKPNPLIVTPLLGAMQNRGVRPMVSLPANNYTPKQPAGGIPKINTGRTSAENTAFEIGRAISPNKANTPLTGLHHDLARGVTGAVGAVEGIADFVVGGMNNLGSTLTSGFGFFPNSVSNWFDEGTQGVLDNDIAGAMRKGIEDKVGDNKNWASNITGELWDMAGGIMSAGAAGKAASGVTKITAPALSKGIFGASAGGNSAQQAYNEGATAMQAGGYGNVLAAATVATESLFSGVPMFGKGVLDDVIKGLDKSPKAVQMLVNMVGEGGEEALQTFITPYLQKIYYNPEAKSATIQQMLTDAAYGAGLSGIMQGAGAIGNIGTKANAAQQNTAISTQAQATQAPTSAQNSLEVKLPTKTLNAVEGVAEPVTQQPGQFEAKAKTFGRSDFEGIKELSRPIIENDDYEHYGIRIQESDTENIGGVISHDSSVWDDGNETSDTLDGVSTVGIDGVSSLSKHGGYYGSVAYLVGSNELSGYGEDAGEKILKDGVVLAKYGADKNGNLFEIKPVQVEQPATFPESSLGAKITNGMPRGTGAASPEFAYQERINQQNSTDTAFTDAERQIEGLRTEDSTHRVVTDKEGVAKAQERLVFDFDGEKADLATKQDWDKVDTTAAHLILRNLVETARQSGDYSEVKSWNKTLEVQKSAQGQALQANKQFANAPEKIVADAAGTLFGENARNISEAKKIEIMDAISQSADTLDGIQQGDTASVVSLIKQLNEARGTTGLFNKNTSKAMSGFLEHAAELDDGFDFLSDVAAQQIRNVANDYRKASPLEAIKSYRIMGMLSKVSTIMRNLVGNNVFDPVETVSQNIAVPLDVLLSKVTGTRSVSVDKSWFSEAKRQGSIDGFVKSAIQVGLDADISDAGSKYESLSGRRFKMTGNPVERLFSTWAKWENYALQSTDEFQKGGIAAESQRGIDALKSRGLIAEDALADRAGEIAKQRTFQNDGLLATATLKLKDAANTLKKTDKQGGSFGLGDLGVPFAKVPANIVAQGFNYSSAGLVKGAWNLAKTLKQANSGTLTVEQQAKAVTDIGRGVSGAAGVAMFTALALKGIIVVAGSDDKDKEALETAEGQRGTQLNISAFERWLKGKDTEWQDGDSLMSIGFLEPINAQMAAAAMIADAYKEDGTISVGDIANATVTSIFQSVVDLPAMSQLSDLASGFRYSTAEATSGKLADAAASYGASQASSFLVPNFIGGIAQGMDNTVRDVYGTKNPLTQAKNTVVSKIPFARESLPARLDNYGKERTYSNNPLLNVLNSNILPGQLGTYKTNEINKELYRLDDAGFDVKYPARKAPNTIQSGGEKHTLSAEEKSEYQQRAGALTFEHLKSTISDSEYKNLPDKVKANMLEFMYDYSVGITKDEFVSKLGLPVEKELDPDRDIVMSFKAVKKMVDNGIDPKTYFAFKKNLNKIDDNGSASQFENAKAIQELSLSNDKKGVLWEVQNGAANEKNPFTGTLAKKGLAPEKSIEIMEYFSKLDKKMEEYQKSESSPGRANLQRSYFKDWLSKRYTPSEVAIIQEVFLVWNMFPAKDNKKANWYAAANPIDLG